MTMLTWCSQKRWSRLRIAQNAANVAVGEAIPLINANAKRVLEADDKAGEEQVEKKAKTQDKKN